MPTKRLNVLFVGTAESGKTNLLYQLSKEPGYKQGYSIPATVGFNFKEVKGYHLPNGKKIDLVIKDLGGDSRIKSVIGDHISDQNVAVLFVDLSSPDNTEASIKYYEDCEQLAAVDRCVVVFTKIDLAREANCLVPDHRLQDMVDRVMGNAKIPVEKRGNYVACSDPTTTNLQSVFECISGWKPVLEQIIEKYKERMEKQPAEAKKKVDTAQKIQALEALRSKKNLKFDDIHSVTQAQYRVSQSRFAQFRPVFRDNQTTTDLKSLVSEVNRPSSTLSWPTLK